jgi:hypothetical protein
MSNFVRIVGAEAVKTVTGRGKRSIDGQYMISTAKIKE